MNFTSLEIPNIIKALRGSRKEINAKTDNKKMQKASWTVQTH